MAAPTTVNIKNLTGTFVMDKTLSDSSIPVLKMQKIPWIVQQAVYYSTITVKLKQTTDEAGVVHIDQEQLSTGTVQHEPRLVTGEWAERDVQFWGKVKGKTSYVPFPYPTPSLPPPLSSSPFRIASMCRKEKKNTQKPH
jgi:hypothetical protein